MRRVGACGVALARLRGGTGPAMCDGWGPAGLCMLRTQPTPHIYARCNRQRAASGRPHKGQRTSRSSASKQRAETGRCVSLLASLIMSCRIYRVADCVAFLQCVVSGLPQRIDPCEEHVCRRDDPHWDARGSTRPRAEDGGSGDPDADVSEDRRMDGRVSSACVCVCERVCVCACV